MAWDGTAYYGDREPAPTDRATFVRIIENVEQQGWLAHYDQNSCYYCAGGLAIEAGIVANWSELDALTKRLRVNSRIFGGSGSIKDILSYEGFERNLPYRVGKRAWVRAARILLRQHDEMIEKHAALVAAQAGS